MKKYILPAFLFSLFTMIGVAQTANWGAVLPALFPTNASGQIHGISRVSQMKFHPSDPNKLYAVSARGGLFISLDGGSNWTVTPGTDFMASARLASVCIDFTNDQIIYLGTGDHNYYYNGNGVMKSTNGGITFVQTTLTNKLVVDMIMDPTNHNTIVAVTNAGIYKTTDAGATWTLKTASRPFDDIKLKPASTTVLYAATTDSAFFRSSDFGDTWAQINTGIVLPSGITNGNGCRLAVTPADPNIVYLGMVSNSGMIYKSTDGGSSFSAIKTTVPPYLTYYDNLSSSSGQGDYNFGIGADRVNANILYLVAHNVWKSTDGGASWTQLTNWWLKVHTDMHQIITSPYNNNQLWNMNDGGVWLSTDAGNNWTPKSDGIYGYEIYHGNCSPTRRDMFSIGTQDNGELYATSSGWFTNRGGDWGSQCAFDYRSNSSMVYYYQNNKRRLVNGSDATYGLPAQVTLLQDIAFHRSNSNLAFVGDTMIYRTVNLSASTPTWTQITNLGKKIMAMHCGYSDANHLYVITNDGNIYVSTNALAASPTFTMYALPGSSNNSASITTIKTNPNVVYVNCNTSVYRSANNGSSWTNITYNLPSVNHVRILADEYYSTNEMVFVASNNTVYYKTAAAGSWTIYNTNLPSRTSVIDLSIYNDSTANTILRVTTYGRGMWETPISNLRALTANLAADNTNPCTGTAVQFSDLSTGNVISRNWSFPGGTPSSSTLANPSIIYNTAGTFNVTLTVSDGVSTSTSTQTNYISTAGTNLNLSEGFEGALDPPGGWKNNDNGTGGYKWVKANTAGGFGNSTNSMMFDNYAWNVQGERDELETFRMDLTSYQSVQLSFDVAYQVYTGYSDSLAVLVSTNCGSSFNRIFVKGGSDLSTSGSGTNNFVPTAGQWRTESISLNAYIGQSLMLEFQNINGYGNKLYIDNINITATVAVNAGIDKTICAGSSTSIGSAPVSGLNYSWSPSTGLSSSSSSNPTASPAATTQYTMTATHALSGIQNTDIVIVTVNPIVTPSVSIGVNSTLACNGQTATFTATPVNGGSTPTYQWKLNGLNTGSGTASYSSTSLSTGDVVSCVMTSNASCTSSPTATSNSITMLCQVTLNLKIFLEGYYQAGSLTANLNLLNISANTTDCDTVSIRLYNPASLGSPAYSYKTVLHTNGMMTGIFPYTVNANSFYIVVIHRSSMETWSKSPVLFSGTTTYDFTTGLNKAYDDGIHPPMKNMGGSVYALYGGDVNQDGTIDIIDMLNIDNDATAFAYGYNRSDCNGDGASDINDMSIVGNNAGLFLFKARP